MVRVPWIGGKLRNLHLPLHAPEGKLTAVPCLLGCLALGLPRLVLLIVWLSSSWLDPVFSTRVWPFLGFLFLPATTLGYAAAWHIEQGASTVGGTLMILVGLLFDLGWFGVIRRRRRQPPQAGPGPSDGPRGGGGRREIVIEAETLDRKD